MVPDLDVVDFIDYFFDSVSHSKSACVVRKLAATASIFFRTASSEGASAGLGAGFAGAWQKGQKQSDRKDERETCHFML